MKHEVLGVLFDKDGTLFDFRRTWEAWSVSFLTRISEDMEHAQRLGAAIAFDLNDKQFAPDSIAIAGTPDEVAEVLLPLLPGWDQQKLVEVLNHEAANAPQAEVTPLASFLDGLAALGLKLGVATNDGETPALAHLRSAAVLDKFDFVAGFDSGYGGKPAPGQLLAFAELMGIPPKSCVMVGDSRHDLLAARAAGFQAIGVLTGLATAEDLSDLADEVFDDITALPQYVAQVRASVGERSGTL